jgi:anti-sigma factor RsiW
MTGRKESQGGDSGRILWRLYEKNRPEPTIGGPTVDPLEMAAYLDDRLDEQGRALLEARCADDPEAVELLAAARPALGQREEAPARVVARAAALVTDPVAPESEGFIGWLRGYIGAPWRPAVAAGAFGLYALLCLASFGLGAGIGLPVVTDVAQEESGEAFELFGPHDDWM